MVLVKETKAKKPWYEIITFDMKWMHLNINMKEEEKSNFEWKDKNAMEGL